MGNEKYTISEDVIHEGMPFDVRVWEETSPAPKVQTAVLANGDTQVVTITGILKGQNNALVYPVVCGLPVALMFSKINATTATMLHVLGSF